MRLLQAADGLHDEVAELLPPFRAGFLFYDTRVGNGALDRQGVPLALRALGLKGACLHDGQSVIVWFCRVEHQHQGGRPPRSWRCGFAGECSLHSHTIQLTAALYNSLQLYPTHCCSIQLTAALSHCCSIELTAGVSNPLLPTHTNTCCSSHAPIPAWFCRWSTGGMWPQGLHKWYTTLKASLCSCCQFAQTRNSGACPSSGADQVPIEAIRIEAVTNATTRSRVASAGSFLLLHALARCCYLFRSWVLTPFSCSTAKRPDNRQAASQEAHGQLDQAGRGCGCVPLWQRSHSEAIAPRALLCGLPKMVTNQSQRCLP